MPHAGEARTLRAARAAAPAPQPGADPRARALAGAAASRLLRHGDASLQSAGGADVRAARGAYRGGRAPLRFSRPVVRVHRLGPAADRREGRARPHGGAAPRQRRKHVRAARRPQRGEHHGLHRGRRPADGHALRRHRPGRADLPDGRARHGRARARKARLPAVGPARRLGRLERHARAARIRGAARQAGGGALRLPHRTRLASPRRSAGSTLVFTAGIGERAVRSASACAARPPGSASSSTRRRTQSTARASRALRAESPHGSFRPTRN